jgi:hypothetical protein
VNDILDKNGKIKETLLNNLLDKRNWISEISKLKASIPKKWNPILKSEQSLKSQVNINKRSNFGENINIENFENKDIQQLFLSKKFESPYIHKFWETTFKKDIKWKSFYYFINKVLINNKIKQLKLKIIHKIIPTNENLFIWKQIESPLCKCCNSFETIDHFFIQCPYLSHFWTIIHNLLRLLNINKKIGLYEIVIGYKYEMTGYNDINILINHIIYVVYKSYFISERRTKVVNMLKILYSDLLILVKYFEKTDKSHYMIKKFYTYLSDVL